MKTCKNDNNKILAKGLCRACYDALPEVIAKRSKATQTAHKFKSYKNTSEFKAYVDKYKETEEYKAWLLAKYRFDYLKRTRSPRVLSRSKSAVYARELRLRKKRGEFHDCRTKAWRKPDTNDSQISQRVTRHSTGSQGQTVSPQA